MDNLTKIIATVGPVTESAKMLEKLILSGVSIFRFNLKHEATSWHSKRIKRLNKIAKRLKKLVGTLIVLQGPELRISMPFEQIELIKGERILLGEDAYKKDKKGFSITYPEIIKGLTSGTHVFADDGRFSFMVEQGRGGCLLKAETAGILRNKKSLNIPGADFSFPVLVEKDFEGLQLASREEVDFISISFIRSAEDIWVVRKEMERYGLKAKVVAKIETRKALDNLDEIISVSDALMVARGDLGVEVPLEQVPYYQKVVIKKCIEQGVPVITATQMLQTMVTSPQPTRAEISDVANAAYDLTDAVMLSAETAVGKYPLEAVEVMRRTIEFNESNFNGDTKWRFDFKIDDDDGLLCDSAYNLYLQLMRNGEGVKGFVVFSESGRTVRLLSRYRPLAPVFAFAPKAVCDSLTLNFGVVPFIKERVLEKREVMRDEVLKAVEFLKRRKLVERGDKLIVLHGDFWAVEGGTSTVKLVTCS